MGEITNGGPVLQETTKVIGGALVRVVKREDDPLCLRLSVGGTATDGYYFVYRGDLEKVKMMLRTCWLAVESLGK